jgi:hypothetical protein
MKRRIYISSPRDEYLDDRSNRLKWAIVRKIEELGYEAQVFGSAEGGMGLPAESDAWTPDEAREVMSRCVGAAILGFPIWKASAVRDGKPVSLVSEYCHYEGALAKSLGLPTLAVLEDGAEERVSFSRYGGPSSIRFPINADETWAEGNDFQKFLKSWKANKLDKRKDVFLAYCGKATAAAEDIKTILNKLNVTFIDWKTFPSGSSILEMIEKAANETTGGIFLFTKDDKLDIGDQSIAAPRDNVIFEAGFFAHAKGHKRVLIIREEGAKMPADLGGIIYENVPDMSDTSALESRLQSFRDEAL